MMQERYFGNDDYDFLVHYGTKRHSGRYPWGSGDDAYQRSSTFLNEIKDLKKQGLTEKEIADGFGIKTTQLRAQKTLAREIKRKEDYARALKLRDKGVSVSEIGRIMGINESSVRSLLDPAIKQRTEITSVTSNMLKDNVAEKKYIDVGLGVENHLGVSRTKLNAALAQLKEEGYEIYYVNVEQLGMPGKYTSVKVLCPPGTEYKQLYAERDKIRTIPNWSEDGGRSFLGVHPPLSIDSKRIEVKYKDDGGDLKDGVIELRRGVNELSLGSAQYAQVRIAVDNTHFMKGMALYSDDLPDGVDIRFNTSKPKTDNKLDALKSFKTTKDGEIDWDNPFGSTIRQKFNEKGELISALNIVGSKEGQGEEGAWDSWSKSIASQVLSKQSPALARRQLDLAYKFKEEEFNTIMSLTNPVVKKQLLDKFADGADSDSVHLKGAALPRQATKLILPVVNIKPTEIYAPTFNDGETVALIRFPHGGTFEIAQVTVNNKNKEARSIFPNAKDAIGVHPDVAKILSGADFDGDNVIVIPNNIRGELAIQTSPPLKGLYDFDARITYPAYDGMKVMSSKTKQTEMGQVSNLITDMTIKGATMDELEKAVRHSMVVIDAEKHKLNYKQSALDNGIRDLKTKYQGGPRKGASTLISRASSEIRVPERVLGRPDPETGAKTYKYTNATYVDKNGEVKQRTSKITRMEKEDDAFALSSGTTMETIYALHANKLKAIANEARKESINMTMPKVSKSAKEVYAKEVASLLAKLNTALKNKPLERQAQVLANAIVKMKRLDNPTMDPDELKKIRNQALAEARSRTGAEKQLIEITQSEWEAIQAHAVSNNVLQQILNNTDLDLIRKLATPRPESNGLTSSELSTARMMLENGYTQAEVASRLGISVSTLAKAMD